MGTDDKKPGLQTQFGDLDERQARLDDDNVKLNRRLDAQDEQMRKIETQGRLSIKQIDGTNKELLTVKQATARTEQKVDQLAEKTEGLVEIADYAKKTFNLLEWLAKRLLPVLVGLGGLIAYWEPIVRFFKN